jgi:hypothetical protein
MSARVSTALVCAPITVAGLFAAHALSYRLTTGSAHDAHALLESTGHGYLHPVQTVGLAVAVALSLAGVLMRLRCERGSSRGAWWIALAPPLAFVVQEHTERLVNDGVLPTGLVLQPVFVFGLLLQVPFAVLALALARMLLALADRVAAAVRPTCRIGRSRAAPRRVPLTVARLLVAPLARRGAGRAPPPIPVG